MCCVISVFIFLRACVTCILFWSIYITINHVSTYNCRVWNIISLSTGGRLAFCCMKCWLVNHHLAVVMKTNYFGPFAMRFLGIHFICPRMHWIFWVKYVNRIFINTIHAVDTDIFNDFFFCFFSCWKKTRIHDWGQRVARMAKSMKVYFSMTLTGKNWRNEL